MSMVEIELDGKTVEVPQGSMVMHAAKVLAGYGALCTALNTAKAALKI